jgi:hypothetical protein
MNQIKRILMSAVDAGGGGNSAPADPPVEAPPAPAPGASGPSITLTQAELDAKIASVAESAFARARDSFYAEARRVAAPKQSAPTKTKDDPSAAITPDPIRLRSLDRALNKAGLATKLSDSQYQRAEKAFAAEDPPDVEMWIKDYFDGFGSAPAPAAAPVAVPTPAAQPPAQPTNAHPASNRGAPPAPNTSLVMSDFARWPVTDQLAYLKEKGAIAYREARNNSLKGRAVKLR